MTFSVVARCPRTGQFGIGAATGVPAVGKLLTHAQPGIGAVATQAKLNPYIGIDGLRYLADGLSAARARDRLASEDLRRETRQFAVIDGEARTAAFTGSACIPWAGHIERPALSAQGNRIAGPEVLEAAIEAFERFENAALADRLMEALVAGDAKGGDIKGEVSATIYVVDKEDYPLWDIRVDEHPDPIRELRRLHAIFREQVVPEILSMPTRRQPAGSGDEDAL
jgi:uncharacterized Ntn-hydrolase superfamily protein